MFLLIEMGIWLIYIIYNAVISIRNPKIMAERDYKSFCEEFCKNWVFEFKSDVGRKLLHLLAVVIILFFWTLGTILDKVGVLARFGLDNYSFSFWLIITIGYGFCAMFMIADLTRLNKFYMLPKWAKKWYCSAIRKDELETFLASTPLVLSFVPILFLPFPIFAAAALIATVSDGLAALIGMKYGKHKFKPSSKKTIEGYLAGVSTTFLIVIIIVVLYQSWMPVSFGVVLAMATISAFLFFLIDALAKNVCDNFLNPIIIGLGMWIVFLISILI
jgi:phytol kinase